MSRLTLDLKVAARTAVRARFVSVLAVIAFALGIGVTTAVFSIFNGVLLAPLPFPAARPAGDGLRHAAGVRDLPGVVSEIPRLARAQPGLLRDRRLDRHVVRADRARAIRFSCAPRGRRRRWWMCSACGRSSAAGTPRTRTGPAARRSRAGVGVLDAAARRRSVDRRPHADALRRALRSDRRHAGGLRAPARRRLRAAAAQAGSGDARQPFPDDLRAAEAGRAAGARDRRDARAGPDARARVRQQPRRRRAVLHGSDRRQHADAAAGAARRGLLRAADCLRERREPAARLGPGAAPRAGDPPRARCRREGSRAPADAGGAAAVAHRRRARRRARPLGAADVRGARRHAAPARGDDRDRRPRARLRRRRLGCRRDLLRRRAADRAADVGAGVRRPRRRRRAPAAAPAVASATGSSSPRSRSRSRCWSAPACWSRTSSCCAAATPASGPSGSSPSTSRRSARATRPRSRRARSGAS